MKYFLVCVHMEQYTSKYYYIKKTFVMKESSIVIVLQLFLLFQQPNLITVDNRITMYTPTI